MRNFVYSLIVLVPPVVVLGKYKVHVIQPDKGNRIRISCIVSKKVRVQEYFHHIK